MRIVRFVPKNFCSKICYLILCIRNLHPRRAMEADVLDISLFEREITFILPAYIRKSSDVASVASHDFISFVETQNLQVFSYSLFLHSHYSLATAFISQNISATSSHFYSHYWYFLA